MMFSEIRCTVWTKIYIENKMNISMIKLLTSYFVNTGWFNWILHSIDALKLFFACFSYSAFSCRNQLQNTEHLIHDCPNILGFITKDKRRVKKKRQYLQKFRNTCFDTDQFDVALFAQNFTTVNSKITWNLWKMTRDSYVLLNERLLIGTLGATFTCTPHIGFPRIIVHDKNTVFITHTSSSSSSLVTCTWGTSSFASAPFPVKSSILNQSNLPQKIANVNSNYFQ